MSPEIKALLYFVNFLKRKVEQRYIVGEKGESKAERLFKKKKKKHTDGAFTFSKVH